MALNNNALTTVATVKTALGITGSDDDALIERLINAASNAIEQYCNRKFARSSVTEKVPGYGRTRLVVSRTPIDTGETITVSYDGDEVDADDYEVENADAGFLYAPGGWLWTAPALPGAVYHPLPGHERKLYEVTYTGGYQLPKDSGSNTKLPEDIQQACIDLVNYLKNADPHVASEKLLSYSVSFAGAAQGIPPRVAMFLGPYVRLSQ